ncbi:MAG: N-acetyltransferase [Clostridiales bacterium]|nr:N-acetyltransferase [Clostridiales bacterium]
MRNDITIRPERPEDFSVIDELVRRSFAEHTGYSDGAGEIALIHEIRAGRYYRPDLSFVALLGDKIVGHFLFSDFPLSPKQNGGYDPSAKTDLIMLAPVAVHADYYRQGIGETMLRLGIEQVKKQDCKGITVEGDFHFYNRLGFETSADYGIHATCGFPMEEPRCMMCMETQPGSLADISGYIVYDMYENA